MLEEVVNTYGKLMYLKVWVDSCDDELYLKYVDVVESHNANILHNDFIDAGFDLLNAVDCTVSREKVNKIDYKVVCSAKMIEKSGVSYNTGFYMYPRSSISKSHLRLANNVGIIDAGYRGHLIGMFDVVYASEAYLAKGERHLQICAPGLVPIYVELVKSKEALGEETTRGEGGFGSTGK